MHSVNFRYLYGTIKLKKSIIVKMKISILQIFTPLKNNRRLEVVLTGILCEI